MEPAKDIQESIRKTGMNKWGLALIIGLSTIGGCFIGIVVAILIISLWLYSTPAHFRAISIGEDGKGLIQMGTAELGTPLILLSDSSGAVRLDMGIDKDNKCYIGLADKDGKHQAYLQTSADGVETSLSLIDKNGKERAVLGNTDTVNEKTGSTAHSAESTLTLFDKNGHVTTQLPVWE